jgi:hypothetical protein
MVLGSTVPDFCSLRVKSRDFTRRRLWRVERVRKARRLPDSDSGADLFTLPEEGGSEHDRRLASPMPGSPNALRSPAGYVHTLRAGTVIREQMMRRFIERVRPLGLAMAAALILVPVTVLSPGVAEAAGSETLTAPFSNGPNGATTANTYTGSVSISVSGSGQASATAYSDAFYVFTDNAGNPITPEHHPDFGLCINSQSVDQYVAPIPAYSSTHIYNFTITASGPEHLTFGVCDTYTVDNTGSFTITVKQQASGTYVALGDSYSAGVGSGGTSGPPPCLQNSNAYPAVWSASHPAYQFTFTACSGATINMVQSQLTAIKAGTTLITLTAGGDPEFAPLLLACSVPTPRGDQICNLANLTAQAYINGIIEPGLKGLYAAIKARAPTAQLIVFGYPDLFPDNLLCKTSDFAEQVDMNKTADVLDAAIAKAVGASTGTTFVDVRPAFASHELCSQAPWLNGIVLNNLFSSFHPNQAGQAQGYEAALAAITG